MVIDVRIEVNFGKGSKKGQGSSSCVLFTDLGWLLQGYIQFVKIHESTYLGFNCIQLSCFNKQFVKKLSVTDIRTAV